MVWQIETTDEYDDWFLKQSENGQESIRMKVELLIEYGPNLPRPHADTLKGSKLKNLKELRAHTENHIKDRRKEWQKKHIQLASLMLR